MRLGVLISELAHEDFRGDPDREITSLAYDSREAAAGTLFVALRGRVQDGHRFIQEAVNRGAVAVVTETDWPENQVPEEAALIRVPNSRRALSQLAVAFYRVPFGQMNLVGITGTNGKTTTSYLLESILEAAHAPTGVIGTVNYRYPGHSYPAPVTTPESLDLMRTLREMADAGVTQVVMEVSSHALDQGRVDDCLFRVAVFTNISRDHLDYHRDMEDYFQAKSCLFRRLGHSGTRETARAVINMDDPRGDRLRGLLMVPCLTFGLAEGCQVRAEGVRCSRSGIKARLSAPSGSVDIHSPLIGHFNIYNILAAAGAAICLDLDLQTIARGISRLSKVPGRLEKVENNRGLPIVVDYAHTPDALQKALETLRPLTRGRLIAVFGCGGDRDTGKREEMGRAAAGLADRVVITSDNPRTEDPAAIVSQIEEGVRKAGMGRLSETGGYPGYLVELDRTLAIQKAVEMAGEQDWILIAGKGHEEYQIIGRTKRRFDDREVAARAASGGI